MKAYHHHQRGLTLLEVSIAISVALAVLLSFAPYHIKLMERGLVEQTAQRTKMVYEAAINYRLDNDNGDWPQSTAVLKEAGYLPDVARQTSWGGSIALESASNGLDLEMKFSLPEMRFVNAVAAKLPVPEIDHESKEITQIIQRPGQEASLSQLQDLAGIRAWTGPHNADNNDLNKVGTLTAKFIATNQEVTLGASCSPATEDEKKNKPGKGGRAMIKLGDGDFAPVFCDGTKWVTEAHLSQCKVCIACKHKHPQVKTGASGQGRGSWFRGACDYPDDDGWAVARDFLSGCGSNGRGMDDNWIEPYTQGISLAIKFVCGPDKTAGKFPDPYYFGSDLLATWEYHPSDQTNPEEYVTNEDK